MEWKLFFTNEAISNYLVFAGGLVVGLLIHLTRKLSSRPAIVELEKQKEVSLLTLSSDARDRLKVTYEDEPVDNFHLTIFDLHNRTGATVEDISLKLYLKTDTKQKLFEVSVEDPLEDLRSPRSTAECVVEESGLHYLAIRTPFLNDFRHDKDRITIKVYSPSKIQVERLVGGGKGWMGKFFDRVAFNEKQDGIVRDSNSLFEMLLYSTVVDILRRWR